MNNEKDMSTLIADMELSVRAYACLKNAGVFTLADLFELLDKGMYEIKKIKNLGRKALEEVLLRVSEFGYNSTEFIEQAVINQELTEDFGSSGEELFNKLPRSRKLKPINQEMIHIGRPLYDLGISVYTWIRLSGSGICTVEEVMSYKLLSDIPVHKCYQWELIEALDKEGIRYEDCSKEKYPDIHEFVEKEREKHFHKYRVFKKYTK